MPIVTVPTANAPCWVDLATTDVSAAAQFYGEVLGWSFQNQGGDFGHYHMASLKGHDTAGIGPMHPGGAPVPHWPLYLQTDNVDATVEEVKRLGGSVLAPPMDVGPHGRMAIIADPDGAALGLWQAGEHRGVGIRDEPGAFAWCEVNTRAGGAVVEFLERLTGLAPKQIPGMQYWAFHTPDDKAHFGVLQMTEEWGDMPPHWMPYFAVASANDTAAKLPELGGKVHHGPFDSPYGRILIAADPQGAAVTFIELATHNT